jgi:beta-lactamase class A
MCRITRSTHILLALLIVGVFTVSGATQHIAVQAQAQTITPQAALVRVLTAPHEQSAWFAPLFLAQVSAARVEQGIAAISDNTAANMLIRVVGRAAIDPLIPANDRPILTTRELFVLKDPANRTLRDRYLAATTPGARLSILQQADRLPLPSLATIGPLLTKGPVSPRVEWFFSVRDLCGLMGQVQHLPQMSVNPGVANPADWMHVAYKGGSEPGALNLTTMVTAHDGATYCVAATWNNAALLDEGRFEALYSSLLHALS